MLFNQNSPKPSDADRILTLVNATADIGVKNAAVGWSLLFKDKTAEEVQAVYSALGIKAGRVNLSNAVLGVALNVVARKLANEELSANELAYLAAVEALLPELDAKPVKLVPPYPISTDGLGNVAVG